MYWLLFIILVGTSFATSTLMVFDEVNFIHYEYNSNNVQFDSNSDTMYNCTIYADYIILKEAYNVNNCTYNYVNMGSYTLYVVIYSDNIESDKYFMMWYEWKSMPNFWEKLIVYTLFVLIGILGICLICFFYMILRDTWGQNKHLNNNVDTNTDTELTHLV